MIKNNSTPAPLKTIILADGNYPTHEMPLKHLREADLIVCCDGAAEKLVAHGLEPGIIIGDLDSVSASLKERYADILVPDADQETNDLTKAVKWCVAQGINEVVILGATGIREDHTLANISLLAGYCEKLNVVMLTNTGTFRVYDRSATIVSHPGQQVSIFSIDPTLTVTSSGLRYPLNNLRLYSWWRGTLNEAEGESFRLEFAKGQIIVFMEHTNPD